MDKLRLIHGRIGSTAVPCLKYVFALRMSLRDVLCATFLLDIKWNL